jgi:hypothetical protein
MDISTELVDRILTDVFAEVARRFIADGHGVVIEQVDLEGDDK